MVAAAEEEEEEGDPGGEELTCGDADVGLMSLWGLLNMSGHLAAQVQVGGAGGVGERPAQQGGLVHLLRSGVLTHVLHR